MPEVTIRRMFEAGAHFGHQTRFWNPKMEPYIFGARNKIHIIDLDKSLPLLNEALVQLKSTVSDGGKVLFVGTKRAAGRLIKEHAERCGMPYINHRWLGGTLTNFRTVRQSVKRYINLEEEYEKKKFADVGKKTALKKLRELKKLERSLQGIKDMVRQPQALFVVDVRHERIAINEAQKLGIPVIAIVDTNNSLEGVAYPIPGNDDAIRAIDMYVSTVADTVLEGLEDRAEEGEYIKEEEDDDAFRTSAEAKNEKVVVATKVSKISSVAGSIKEDKVSAPKTDTKAEAETAAEAAVETDTKAETETAAKAEAETDTKAEAETAAKAEAETDTKAEAGTVAEAVAETAATPAKAE